MYSSSSSAVSEHENFDDSGIELPLLTRVNKLRPVAINSSFSNYSISSEDSNPENTDNIVAVNYHQSLSEMAGLEPDLPATLLRNMSQKNGNRASQLNPHGGEPSNLDAIRFGKDMQALPTGGFPVDNLITRGQYSHSRGTMPLGAVCPMNVATEKDSVDGDDVSLPEIEKTFEENVRQSKASALNGDHLKFGGAGLPAADEDQVLYKHRVSIVINDHVKAINKTIDSVREELGVVVDSNVVVGNVATEPATSTKLPTAPAASRPASNMAGYVQNTAGVDAEALKEAKSARFNKICDMIEHIFWGSVTVSVILLAIFGSILTKLGYGRQWPAPTPIPEN